MNAISQQLETIFRRIEQECMKDMPMCNPALSVQAIGFAEWGEFYLGVMLTPWFMNLMLLPRDVSTAEDYQLGSKRVHVLPSGRYEFVMAEEEGLGKYQVCSLFSPVFEFGDQQTAVTTAITILDEVMKQENRDTISTHEKVIQQYWQESDDADVPGSETTENAPAPALEQGIETPMSRRQLLRGMLPQQKAPGRGD